MRNLFSSLVVVLVLVLAASYAWTHKRQMSLVAPPTVPTENKFTPPTYAEAQEAQKLVTMTGPLADYMARHEGTVPSPEAELGQADSQMETLEGAPKAVVASDHVGGSVVGSSLRILHQTFRVHSTAQVTFVVPAHAATPRLRGAYESFFKQAEQESGTDAEIEFLVLNEQQFADFLSKRAGEATFSAADAHAQEVNTRLPPTLAQPEKYHLIFRNNSRGPERKFVQADFRMEF